MSEDNFENDCLTDDDLKQLDRDQEKVLEQLYSKVRDSDEARQWLNTGLGVALRKYLAADKMRAMKQSATATTYKECKRAQFDFAIIEKVESLFGSIIVDGQEALNELEQLHEGDTNG